MIKKLIFFDVETNGLKGSSVLSLSAMKVSYNTENGEMLKLGEFNRFYYRKDGEEVNEGAINVNGLTDEEITRRRSLSEVEYARTFIEDLPSFEKFCDGATHFIAHNIRFDRSFFPYVLPIQFDTMIENIDIVRLIGKYDSFKWPTLTECANFYKIPLEEDELHQSMYDVIVMARVFYKMRNHSIAKERIKRFVNDDISTNFRKGY